MTISIICTDKDPFPWVEALKAVDASLDIQVWPNEKRKSDVSFALCWKHPAGVLQDYPNMRCISSMGAGIDHFLKDPHFPKAIPAVRLVDPQLAESMFEYILTSVMVFLRDFDVYQTQQKRTHWHRRFPKRMSETTIGIMGLGQLGYYSANKFAEMGFKVMGWSRSPKTISGVMSFAGEEQLNAFLGQTDILVCLLPLTDQTRGILNRNLFAHMPRGSYLVNVARGEHLVEEDLMLALNEGQLNGACLDVFQQEPLPAEHAFWRHDKILVTPHGSSITNPKSVAPQIVQNYRLMQNGEPLLNLVDMPRGY